MEKPLQDNCRFFRWETELHARIGRLRYVRGSELFSVDSLPELAGGFVVDEFLPGEPPHKRLTFGMVIGQQPLTGQLLDRSEVRDSDARDAHSIQAEATQECQIGDGRGVKAGRVGYAGQLLASASFAGRHAAPPGAAARSALGRPGELSRPRPGRSSPAITSRPAVQTRA
jgi:hypothetical protein